MHLLAAGKCGCPLGKIAKGLCGALGAGEGFGDKGSKAETWVRNKQGSLQPTVH